MSFVAAYIYSQYEAAFEFPSQVMDLIKVAICEYQTTPSELSTNSVFEAKYRGQLNAVLKSSCLGKEDRRVAKYSLQACMVLLALHDYESQNSSLLYSEAEFLSCYPDFGRLAETPVLVRFRNIVAVSLTLMRFENNKAKHLTIATRLSEGKDARYITGSGQSLATTRRVTILERESSFIQLLACVTEDSTETNESDDFMMVATQEPPPGHASASLGLQAGADQLPVTESVSDAFASVFQSLYNPAMASCLDHQGTV